ncbi:hypothetical protein BDN71DRAFT_1593501 [Pleurotus eryngii]|uniref:Uncharacterized protein n=1 Tax=Pleurotus eryngii TaxID=5323 RepID=A0A9P5ZMK5_PLEER|nr:hypothetical protein BDN71DRAFT_1593501 [Pleurotus eryngii]
MISRQVPSSGSDTTADGRGDEGPCNANANANADLVCDCNWVVPVSRVTFGVRSSRVFEGGVEGAGGRRGGLSHLFYHQSEETSPISSTSDMQNRRRSALRPVFRRLLSRLHVFYLPPSLATSATPPTPTSAFNAPVPPSKGFCLSCTFGLPGPPHTQPIHPAIPHSDAPRPASSEADITQTQKA